MPRYPGIQEVVHSRKTLRWTSWFLRVGVAGALENRNVCASENLARPSDDLSNACPVTDEGSKRDARRLIQFRIRPCGPWRAGEGRGSIRSSAPGMEPSHDGPHDLGGRAGVQPEALPAGGDPRHPPDGHRGAGDPALSLPRPPAPIRAAAWEAKATREKDGSQ